MRPRIRSALITTAAMLLGGGPALAASDACKADLTGDGVVNFADLAKMKSVFFQRCTICGDGVVQGTEQCDDGNLLDGDGCSATCTIEPALPANALLATGRTMCRNSGGTVISCASTGQDGELQKGAALAYRDNGDGTITDINTGLMWEKLDNNDVGGIHDYSDTYTWDNAFAVKIATLNGGGGFAGHADWRLPNVRELHSIVNFQNINPAVSAAFNAGCGAATCTVNICSCTTLSGYAFPPAYWSSSGYALTPSSAWGVSFGAGGANPNNKTNSLYVRAVRGGP